MMKLPEELESAAAETNAALGEGLAARIRPAERPFKPVVLDAFRKAIKAACKLLSVECEFPQSPNEIDPETARYYAMIEQAAASYGQPLPVGLEGLVNDRAVTADTAAISSLVADRDFKAFLKEPVDEEAEPEMEKDEPSQEEPMNFASRMR
jgi:hypothetical protein